MATLDNPFLFHDQMPSPSPTCNILNLNHSPAPDPILTGLEHPTAFFMPGIPFDTSTASTGALDDINLQQKRHSIDLSTNGSSTKQQSSSHDQFCLYSLAHKITVLEGIVKDLNQTNLNQNDQIKQLSNYLVQSTATPQQPSPRPRPQSMFGLGSGIGMSAIFPVIQPQSTPVRPSNSNQSILSQGNHRLSNAPYDSDVSFYLAPTPISSTPNSSAMMTRSTSFPSHLSNSVAYMHQQQQQQQQQMVYYQQQQLNQQFRDQQSDSISLPEMSGYSSPNSSFEKRVLVPHGSPSPCGGRALELSDTALSSQRTSTSSFAAIAPVVAQAQWLLSQNASRGAALNSQIPLPNEYINFRALLDSDAEVDIDLFIRRIITQNDQQASIFLQQRLKTCATREKKAQIGSTVRLYLLDLSLSKFGNFLVSRCLEFGEESLVTGYLADLAGNLLALSYDQFGCHVVQKLIDTGGEKAKTLVISEIIDHISTLTHKSSGHVWSKIISSRNTNSFYQHLALTGSHHWAEIARDETGSLLVQSILENWRAVEDSQIVVDCLESFVECANSQWGSFSILILIEHAGPKLRLKLFEQISPSFERLALDTFGAKALERIFKFNCSIRASIVTKFATQLCQARSDDNHSYPLIVPVASHASGSQLLIQLFTGNVASMADKELLIKTIHRFSGAFGENKHAIKVYYLVERARGWKQE